MKNLKLSLIALLLILSLVGCQNTEKQFTATEEPAIVDVNELESQLKQLNDENASLKAQLKETQEKQVSMREQFSVILNLSLKTIHAMNTKDYRYLEFVAASGVTFDKKNHKLKFPVGDKTNEVEVLDQVDFGKIEYRGYLIENDEAIVHFAIYENDSHITIDMQFVNELGWKFNGFITNA